MKPQEKMEVTSPIQLGGGGEEEGLGLGLGLSPVSSRYSSCDESEFDRYCSANSRLGTPASVCSSIGHFHDSMDSDFEGFKLGGARVSRPGKGYARSLLGREAGLSGGHCESSECDNGQGFEGLMGGLDDGEGDDFGAIDCFEGFNLDGGGRVSRSFKGKGKGNGNNRSLLGREAGFSDHGEGLEGSVDDGEGSPSSSGGEMKGLGRKEEGKVECGGEVGKKENLAVILKNVENVLLQGAVAARSAAENLLECSNRADEMDDERCREEDETSSRYEHSEGEDSMFNYGSDDDYGSHHRADYVNYAGDHQHREDGGFRNSMLMNSSVAFGSNDWEEFESDGMENMKQIPEDFWVRQQSGCENEIKSPDLTLMRSTPVEKFQWLEEETSERKVATNNDLLEVKKSLECSHSSIAKTTEAKATESIGEALGKQKLITSNEELDEYPENCSVYNVFQKQSPTEHDVGENESMMCEKERKKLDITSDISSGHDDLPVPLQCLNSPPHILEGEDQFPSDIHKDLKLDILRVQGVRVETSPEEYLSNSASTVLEREEGRICGDSHCHDNQNSSSQPKDFEVNDLYDEFVHDMEEILLESCGSPGITLKQKNSEFQFEQSSLGIGESISSGFVDGNILNHHPLRIDKVEVVGAKQKKGDISLSERLVGIKEYTVYIIRVWSGKYQWDVERRYRDFYELYHQLKTYFAARKWILPPVWSSADTESKKFFGSTSPNVVAERSTLIQECLCTILQSNYCSSLPSCLIWFLSPPEALLSSSQSNVVIGQSNMGPRPERVPSLGKTISLIVDIRSQKSVKELLDTQHYTCAGCHSRIDNGRSRMLEIVQTFGWGKPRLCEYTGQLFCSSCHTNETAVLPARVLHNWDFSPYPVSQMAKSYLDSIVDKPMFCVSAANPSLFSRVPALLLVVGVRRKIGTMLPYIRCSFRRSIYRRLGYRKYLLESNDFFALRDLVDLSKGAFAGLPAILEAVLKKIEEHITELCLECCDNGVPCGARQACDDLSSLIFPFQEDEILRCKSCKSVFHKHCFNKLMECPCGEVLRVNSGSMAGSSSLAMKKSDSKSSSRLLSSLFSFSRQEKGQKERDDVILMGSLPSNSL